ncbi:unnamed protein product [Rhodiola kirilowii]
MLGILLQNFFFLFYIQNGVECFQGALQKIEYEAFNRFWKLAIPRKIKIFLWISYHNGLPTGAQLVKRQI